MNVAKRDNFNISDCTIVAVRPLSCANTIAPSIGFEIVSTVSHARIDVAHAATIAGVDYSIGGGGGGSIGSGTFSINKRLCALNYALN